MHIQIYKYIKMYICGGFEYNTIVLGHTNELRDFALTTQQRKFLFAALSMVCSWCCKTRGV